MSGEIMLVSNYAFQPKTKTIDELKDALQSIWDELPELNQQRSAEFHQACVKAGGGHFEHRVISQCFALSNCYFYYYISTVNNVLTFW